MKSKSVIFCYIACYLCLIAILLLTIFAPQLLARYMQWRALPQQVGAVILIAFYVCCVPAVLALLCLLRILQSIRRMRMFTPQNTALLRVVSWCCLAVAFVTLAAGYWYFPLLFVTAAMLFIFLIVRVVCSLLIAATALKEENSLTI